MFSFSRISALHKTLHSCLNYMSIYINIVVNVYEKIFVLLSFSLIFITASKFFFLNKSTLYKITIVA